MARKRTRKFDVLVWLVVVVTFVSVSVSEEDVVAEADAMAQKIEEENKKVDAQTDAMVRAIENNEKKVDSSEQEKKFEKASKLVDEVMNKSEETVDIKASKAEEIENEAERRVEELGRKIESAANFEKRNTIEIDKESQDNIPNTIDTTANTKNKVVEPSKVVILPDASVRGTDSKNMQIKELQSKSSKGVWLAVHIPDNATVPRPVRIMTTKKAAEDLEKVVGPNKETMFKELQTIIGVDSATLRKMLKAGEVDNINNMRKKRPYDDEEEPNDDGEAEDDEEEDEDGDEDYNDDQDYSGDDVEDCEDEDDYNDDFDDNPKSTKHGDKGSGKKGKCSKLLPWTLDGSGNMMNDEPSKTVYQPSGFKEPLADLLNKIHLKNRKKKVCLRPTHPLIQQLCKEMSEQKGHRIIPNHPHREHTKLHNKYYKHLKHLMRKFLDRHNGAQAKKVLEYMNLLLSDQLRLSSDGVVHLYPNRGKPNSYRDGFNALVNDEINGNGNDIGGGVSPVIGMPLMSQPPLEDSQDGHVIRVPVQASARGIRNHRHFGVISPLQANILNNQVHTKLGDIHSADDLQMQSFKEELGRTNDEFYEQQRQVARDKALMNKYMFRIHSLANKEAGIVNWARMQKDAAARVNDQRVSVISPDQISLSQARIPYKNNVDIPSLGGYVDDQKFKGFTKRSHIIIHGKRLFKPLKRLKHRMFKMLRRSKAKAEKSKLWKALHR